MAQNPSNSKAKEIEKEIIRLKAEVDIAIIDAAEDDITTELQDLRHKILIAHSEAQSFLELYLSYKILVTANPKVNKEEVMTEKEIMGHVNNMKEFFKIMTFSRLLGVVKSMGELDKGFISNINKLNEARIYFAHPKSKGYLVYRDKKKYKAVLENIKSILHEVKNSGDTLTVKIKKVK